MSRFWNIRFDTAFNEVLQVLGTMGFLGLLAFVFWMTVAAVLAWKGMFLAGDRLAQAASLAVLASIVMLLMHTSTVVAMVTFIAALVMLLAVARARSAKVEELQLGIRASKLGENMLSGDILPTLVCLAVIIGSVIVMWRMVFLIQADYKRAAAIRLASASGTETYKKLVEAEKLAIKAEIPIDLYRRDLANVNFLLANGIVSQKTSAAGSPAAALTDEERSTIQQLIKQAVDESRVAVAINPLNPENWEVLGAIYRQISGVAQNAMVFSLDAYGRAIQRDPLNPLLRLTVGGIYYSLKNYDLAIRFFSDAVALKPDFANGYYNLAIALRDKGDIRGAIVAAEQVIRNLEPSNPDYEVASKFLAELRAADATSSAASTSKITPPAAQEQSPLQRQNLPNVVDLGEEPVVATPPAVRSNNSPSRPSPSPSPSPRP